MFMHKFRKNQIIHTANTHTYTQSNEVGSDSRRLMLLTEMIWVLKVLNTVILFDPSRSLSVSSHLLQHLLTSYIWLDCTVKSLSDLYIKIIFNQFYYFPT